MFRCDTPAKAIATSLHEICSKVSGSGRRRPASSLPSRGRGVGRGSARSGRALGAARRPPGPPVRFIVSPRSAVALNGASPTEGAGPWSPHSPVGLISRKVATWQQPGVITCSVFHGRLWARRSTGDQGCCGGGYVSDGRRRHSEQSGERQVLWGAVTHYPPGEKGTVLKVGGPEMGVGARPWTKAGLTWKGSRHPTAWNS